MEIKGHSISCLFLMGHGDDAVSPQRPWWEKLSFLYPSLQLTESLIGYMIASVPKGKVVPSIHTRNPSQGYQTVNFLGSGTGSELHSDLLYLNVITPNSNHLLQRTRLHSISLPSTSHRTGMSGLVLLDCWSSQFGYSSRIPS